MESDRQMKRLLCFVGLALISQVACAGSWIAYPGDWALWTGNELQARRIEFGGGYPVFWTTYAAHPQIDFKRHVRLAHPVDARIDARGVVIVKGCGPRVGVIDGKYTFPAGEYDVVVRVFNQAHPPSLKIDGSGVDTDGFWNADWRMTVMLGAHRPCICSADISWEWSRHRLVLRHIPCGPFLEDWSGCEGVFPHHLDRLRLL